MSKKVVGFDGREYPWTLVGYIIKENDRRPRSSYHLRCRAVLRKMFTASPICEEVALPGSGSLRLDFYLPDQRLGIEVQGEQHFQPVGKFHEDKKAFLQGQRRDEDKRRWCELNNVRLVELRYDADDAEWQTQIFNG